MSRRGLQALLAAIGAVAVAAGVRDALSGSRGVIDGAGAGPVPANVDSEFRFYSSWYAVIGALVLGAARRPEAETTVVRACGAGFLLAAVSRLLSMRTHGAPHRLLKVLTVIEFVIPATIIPWQRALSR